LEKLLARLDEQVLEQEGHIAAAGAGASTDLLQPLVHLREQVRAALARVQAGEAKHAHPLEPDAARMECDGRNRFGYNAQAVVDTKAQIVVASEVTNAASDMQQLVPMIAAAQSNCEVSENEETSPPTTLADGGYASGAQLAKAERCGYPVLTPPAPNWHDTSNPYHTAHFCHDAARRVVICPQGRELVRKGVRQKDGREVEIYRNRAACKDCPVRAQCTSERGGRSIYIAADHAAVVAAHARWNHPQTAEFYGLRAATVEPVFAQVKQQMGFRRWTVRGLENVRTQWSLLLTTWNLRVMLRHWRGAAPGGSARGNRPQPAPSPRVGGGLSAARTACGRLLRDVLAGCARLKSCAPHFFRFEGAN
jgi:hypothetical protein